MCELKTPSSELWPPTLTRLEISRDVRVGDSIVGISPPTSIGLERSTDCEEEEREVRMGEECLCGQISKAPTANCFQFFPFFG